MEPAFAPKIGVCLHTFALAFDYVIEGTNITSRIMGGFQMGLFNGGFNGFALILVLFVLLTIVGVDD
ncbi:hypothetical protein BAG01nite_25810 [Brevibacillus agri]|uniref:Uncharacterized protein n=2 Tax=Brevibacillus agri TaxID=51101 RepID=A0ABQ0SRH6_9BACL|nr:putative transmembrane protein [Brevibacillus sp. CF112]GED26479.1 hypothetical protein BAG01nite_25810 [Brevibacillus agri]